MKHNSAKKRLKVTKNGKVLHRPAGNTHSKTRKSNKNLNRKKRKQELDYRKTKIVNY